ncbi:unnamed protein product [Schistosoma turkestanicum]|nr:unnamed protein product [Schistosoma turkestanicum]
MREIFRSFFEQRNQFSSIHNNTRNEVHDLFMKLKRTLTQSLSSIAWTSDGEKLRAIYTVDRIEFWSYKIDDFHKISNNYLRTVDSQKRFLDNYYMNVYLSQTLNYYVSVVRLSFISNMIRSDGEQYIIYPGVYLAAALIQPSFLSEYYSITEKYGILSWIIGRTIIYEAFRNQMLDESSQSKCESEDLSAIENQLCCVSRQINNRTVEKKRYGDHMTGHDSDLKKKKSFFKTFAKGFCNGFHSDLIGYVLQSFEDKFSVNDILKHSYEFSETYQCPLGSKMNPVDKCTF